MLRQSWEQRQAPTDKHLNNKQINIREIIPVLNTFAAGHHVLTASLNNKEFSRSCMRRSCPRPPHTPRSDAGVWQRPRGYEGEPGKDIPLNLLFLAPYSDSPTFYGEGSRRDWEQIYTTCLEHSMGSGTIALYCPG